MISLTCFLFFLFANMSPRMYTTVLFGILIILQTIWLIFYVNRTNREITRFLVRFYDGESIGGNTGKSLNKNFRGLLQSFEKVGTRITDIRIEKEKKDQLLRTVVNNVRAGILTFDNNGKIELFNESASNIFQTGSFSNISSLDKLDPGLSKKIQDFPPEVPQLIQLNIKNEFIQLLMRKSCIVDEKKTINILSFQNIKAELENKELDSWQKLIRVLTHEISNSLTPINTLITAIKRSIGKNDKVKLIDELDQDVLTDTYNNTRLVEERSKGLIDFVGEYRKLSRIPNPKINSFSIEELFYDIKKLKQIELQNSDIELSSSCNPLSLNIGADKSLIEQIIINLINNSIEAISKKSNGKIDLKAEKDQFNRILIHIEDNGRGISEEIIDNIFIPFYTTKENGSGIGLSLSRQIMSLHGGNISVFSKPGIKTVFTLKF